MIFTNSLPIAYNLYFYIKLLQGNHNNCHKDSLSPEDGYVCSKKPLISERAIVAYRKATEGTTIFENAEDYALAILMNSYGAALYLMILFPVKQRMMNTLLTSSLQR